MLDCQKKLRKRANPKEAILMGRFFKNGPGQYGAGDIFLGGTNTPALNLMAKTNQNLSFKQIDILLKSKYHEERALALKILVIQYQKTKDIEKKKQIVDFYLSHYRLELLQFLLSVDRQDEVLHQRLHCFLNIF